MGNDREQGLGIIDQINNTQVYDGKLPTKEEFLKWLEEFSKVDNRKRRQTTWSAGNSLKVFLLGFNPEQDDDRVIYIGSILHDELREVGLFNEDGTTNMNVYIELMYSYFGDSWE